jgi:hypothetical protein
MRHNTTLEHKIMQFDIKDCGSCVFNRTKMDKKCDKINWILFKNGGKFNVLATMKTIVVVQQIIHVIFALHLTNKSHLI